MKSQLYLIWICLANGLPAQVNDRPNSSGDDRPKLEKDGMIVTGDPLRQGFSAYIGSKRPVFVTSDSLLMTYHRLLEAFVAEREMARMTGYRKLWKQLWKHLPARPVGPDAKIAEDGHRRARLLVGTSYRLLFGKFPEGITDGEKELVAREVDRVEKAEGDAPPEWMNANGQDPKFVSYRVFAPIADYSGKVDQERYYRFRKWLQELTLDLGDKVLFSAFEHMALGIRDVEYDTTWVFRSFIELEATESGLLHILGGNNSYPHGDGESGKTTWRANVMEEIGKPAHRAILDVTVPAEFGLVRGLLEKDKAALAPELIGAALGSELAGSSLPADLKLLASLGKSQDSHYLDALRQLHNAPDKRAPNIIRSLAWKRKQLNTTLGSWAEFRYAEQLGTKENAHWMGVTDESPGFVEPVPGFYHALGEEVERLGRIFEWDRDYLRMARSTVLVGRLGNLAEAMRKIQVTRNGDSMTVDSNYLQVSENDDLLNELFPVKDRPPRHWDDTKDCEEVAGLIDQLVHAYGNEDQAVMDQVARIAERSADEITPRLGRLASMCFRLEAMAERQLSGQEWTESDIAFLKDYGKQIALIMFYEGNSFLTPRDDAPRIARYGVLGTPEGQKLYHAATARPRLFLIRYPGRDKKEIICQGAVYAFRQVTRTTTPSNEEWLADADKTKWPDWMTPMVEK